MKLDWALIGKSLTALVTTTAALASIYVIFTQQKAQLEAYLTYDYQNYPRQFIQRLDIAKNELGYSSLYEKYKEITEDKLSHEQLNKITKSTQNIYQEIFSQPFNKGLDDYRTTLFVYLKNKGDKIAENVYIKLPANGMVMIRDDSKNYEVIESKTNNILIPSIVQNGDAKIWVYFDSDYQEVVSSSINIGHKEGLADINIYENYSGTDAMVAQNSTVLLVALAGLVLIVVSLLTIELFGESNPKISTNQKKS